MSNFRSGPEEIRTALNKSFEALFHRTKSGEAVPHVCIVCDEFVGPLELVTISAGRLKKAYSLLVPPSWDTTTISSELKACYTNTTGPLKGEESTCVEDMLLSPRAYYLSKESCPDNVAPGFSCCSACKAALNYDKLPRFAIANNYYVGTPPPELRQLTDIELAMLSPVRTQGHVFSYTGGTRKVLKGSLTYYRVDLESIVRTTAHFEALGMNEHVVVILYGWMTPKQRAIARQKNILRTGHVMRAAEWLLANNQQWIGSSVSLTDIFQNLRNPVLIDNSIEQDSLNANDSNIETTESFQVFFPDATLSPLTGGQDTIEDFKRLVRESNVCGYDMEVQCDLQRKMVQDFRDENFVNACIMQFPYGRGGMQERRIRADGSFTSSVGVDEYIRHMSKLSQPQFHRDLFTLMLYNLSMKQHMLRSAGWRVRSKQDAASLAVELQAEDVDEAILAKQSGAYSERSHVGRRFLDAIDAISRAVPHTNGAARKARQDAEALQHRFGIPSFFLTVTPDDDNSFLMQIHTYDLIDGDKKVASLSDIELVDKARMRKELRLKYPGISGLVFERLLFIIIETVVGWDLHNNRPTERPGLFGVSEAFTGAIEEQGRKSLHVHMLIWTKAFAKCRERIFSPSRHDRRDAEASIIEVVDDVSTTKVFDEHRCPAQRGSLGAFPHTCVSTSCDRKRPQVVDDQSLRDLRHKIGCDARANIFAYCPDCYVHCWTSDRLLESYLILGLQLDGLTHFPDNGDNDCKRLKAMCVEYQADQNMLTIDGVIVEAAYNFHSHVKSSCFKKSGSGRRNKCKRAAQRMTECRYRLPQRKKRNTVFQETTSEPCKWYDWKGNVFGRHVKEVCVRRHAYDAFQNVSCPAIGHSKMTCNTNVAAIMPGPIAPYTFKYHIKETQKDDTAEYERVGHSARKSMQKAQNLSNNGAEVIDANQTLYQTHRSAAMKRLLSASHAHNMTNILGSPMAAYLTRQGKRFVFSHKTVWVPLRDLRSLTTGGRVSTSLLFKNKRPFFECMALHYLCRPVCLENINAHDFYSLYEVRFRTARNTHDLLSFLNTQWFTHPSYSTKDASFAQGMKKLEHPVLPKILQYDFPDTATFGGNILQPETRITSATETYSCHVLLFFHAYRSLADIMLHGTYTLKLREAVRNGAFPPSVFEFLQNLQDARSNCMRTGRTDDDLQRCTEPFMPADAAFDAQQSDDDESINDDVHGEALDNLLREFDREAELASRYTSSDVPVKLDLTPLRDKGSHKCGYECLDHADTMHYQDKPLHETLTGTEGAPVPNEAQNESMLEEDRMPGKADLVKVLIQRRQRRRRTFQDIIGSEEPVDVLEANGSVKSIMDWSCRAQLDKGQRRAFEIMTSTFVLTFYEDASPSDGNEIGRGMRNLLSPYFAERKKLCLLSERHRRGNDDQIILFLHGPGGSGKTTVIDLVMEYAREFCAYLEQPFGTRTIVLTAMTGVAATLLLGETAHAALYLNRRKELEPEQCEPWSNTRLLIIDEISFASRGDFEKMDRNLKRLKSKISLPYGGQNIVFAGDLRQLEPVGAGKQPVYKDTCVEFQDWVNCYIELDGLHRFKEDKEWGLLLRRFRNGGATAADIDKINRRVAPATKCVHYDDPKSTGLRYATFRNRDRDAINTALFETRSNFLKDCWTTVADCMLILADDIKVKNSIGQFIPFTNCRVFWENCGEDDVNVTGRRGRMDPALKLYRDCPVMLPLNINVSAGQANGTQALVKKIVLKPGVQPSQTKIGTDVLLPVVTASQVSHVVLEHCNKRIRPREFFITPKSYAFVAKIPKPRMLRLSADDRERFLMRATQVPILLNNATTGHKLQGSGVARLFVHSWSYTTNWVYVMLSRVKTYDGLFCRLPLTKDLRKYAMPKPLQNMMDAFAKRAVMYWTPDQYDELFGLDAPEN